MTAITTTELRTDVTYLRGRAHLNAHEVTALATDSMMRAATALDAGEQTITAQAATIADRDATITDRDATITAQAATIAALTAQNAQSRSLTRVRVPLPAYA